MEQILRNKLENLANNFSDEGIEFIDNIGAAEFLDIEEWLNHEISHTDGDEQDKLLQIRFFLRIILKYGRDLSNGIKQLQKYQS